MEFLANQKRNPFEFLDNVWFRWISRILEDDFVWGIRQFWKHVLNRFGLTKLESLDFSWNSSILYELQKSHDSKLRPILRQWAVGIGRG